MEDSLLIAGSGGQGVLLLGRLIAAVAMLSGHYVTWFPSYGAEMRGGTANCTVVISSEMIGSPVVSHPNTFIIMNYPSLKKFSSRFQKGSLLIVDSSLISKELTDGAEINKQLNALKLIAVPGASIASELGSVRYANMVLFGAYLKAKNLASIEVAELALKKVLPERHHNKLSYNIQAIKRGWEFV